MALVSKSEAARKAGVSRTTIHRYIKDGKLSATSGKIDEAELYRVFGTSMEQPATPVQGDSLEQRVTQGERVLLRDQISQLEAQLRDTRTERDHWRDRADQAMDLLKAEQENIKLITDQSERSRSGTASIGIAVITVALLLVAVIYLASS